MRRRRLNILIVLMVLAFCRLLHNRSVTPAPAAQEIAATEEHPTTAPSTIATEKERDPSWDWLLVRNVPAIDSPSGGSGESTMLASFLVPRIRVFPLPDSPGLWNRSNQTNEAMRLVGGLFDDHFKTPSDPWIDPPVSPTPRGEDPPATPVVPPAVPSPALAISTDPPSFGDPPPSILIPPPAPVGGPSSLPPIPGPVSTPAPEPNSIILPLAILLLARRFPGRG